MILSDKDLSQRLERTEAQANIDFVETRNRLQPEHGAAWIEVGGAFAMFDGVESPLTQTFCLGLFDEIQPSHLDQIEAFFKNRSAPVFHEVSPLAHPSLMPLMNERGYHPVELSSIMCCELPYIGPVGSRTNPDITTRVISPDEAELWAATSAAGWAAEHEELGEFMLKFGRISALCEGAFPYLAELEGKPISTGMLFIYEDVCILAGTSTIPASRNRGAQNALLRDRLTLAADRGCTLAMMGASPGSASQKNAQRNGFNIAYTRTKWQLKS